MVNYEERYDLLPAVAWLRGHSLKTGIPVIRQELLDMPLEVLTDAELQEIVETGVQTGQKAISL